VRIAKFGGQYLAGHSRVSADCCSWRHPFWASAKICGIDELKAGGSIRETVADHRQPAP
jgi:hypothetical protein